MNVRFLPARTPSSGLVVVHEHFPGVKVLHVFDEVDLATASELEAEINTMSGAERIVLNFAECRYVDSTTLSVLVRTYKILGERLQVIAPLGGVVQRLLAITGLDQVLTVVRTLDQALAA